MGYRNFLCVHGMSYEPTKTLRENPGDRWMLRWGFEFVNRPTKVGGWLPASRIEDMASSVNKDGLLWAYIEGKHWTHRDQSRIFVRVAGQDFINFEHLAVLIQQGNGRSINHVYGMRIQTRNEAISCFEDGSITNDRKERGSDFVYPEWTRF